MSESTCLVTGGAGFIGCAISTSLVHRFDRVVAIDNLHPQVHRRRERPRELDERVELVVGDITQPSQWRTLLEDVAPTVVLHLAAETGTGQSLMRAARHTHVNVTGTAQMLDALAEHKCIPERIVLTSSRAVYGEGAWWNPQISAVEYPGPRSRAQLESRQWDFNALEPLPSRARITEPRPISIYGATKLAQEQILRAWAAAHGATSVLLRLQNVYGPGQSLDNHYTGICSLFARIAYEHESIPVYEDGKIVRDFVYVDDVVAAILSAIAKSGASDAAYDIGSGCANTIRDVAGIIASVYDAPPPHINGAFRHGDVRHAACSIEDAVPELDWCPRTSLIEGIGRLCAWVSEAQGYRRTPKMER